MAVEPCLVVAEMLATRQHGAVAISREANHQFEGEYAAVFSAACDAVQAEGMTIRAADVAAGTIAVSSSMSMFSWGENAEIRVWQQAPGNAVVAVHSSLKFGLVDWGKNRRNIEALFARIDELLRSPRSVAPAAANRSDASPGWYRDQTSRHELRYWDGTAWTPHFSDGGVVGADPS